MTEALITNLGAICPKRARIVALARREWNKERTELLHTMWKDNFTYSKMAKILNVSIGAIAGKVRRMKKVWEAMA